MRLHTSCSRQVLAASGLLAASAIVLASCTGAEDTEKPEASVASFCDTPAGMPSGFDYPQSAETIKQWVADRDSAATRGHGWNLFAGLQSDADGAWVWQSWCTATQAFAPASTDVTPPADQPKPPAHGDRPMRQFKLDNGPTSGEEPINFPDAPLYAIPDAVAKKYKGSSCILPPSGGSTIPSLASGPQFQNNGDVMVAGVVYNDAAFQWIRKNSLFDPATLQGMRPASNMTAQMPSMPTGSIVLKPMLWPVSASGYTALPVWDDLASDNGEYSGFEIQSQWSRAVAVTAKKDAKPKADVTYLSGGNVTYRGTALGPITYKDAPVADIGQFYHFKPDVKALNECDRALLDASAYYAYGRMFEQGDYLALVAMHIMTKEQPSWTFQSVWWSDQPDSGPYAADRPSLPNAKGPWQHYLMASTYGWPEKKDGTTWPVAYNPYIELAADHPIKTNCQNCHSRAAWPNINNTGYLKPGGPGALDMFEYEGNPIFNGLIGVDSLWSISDRVTYTPPKEGEQQD